VRRRALATVSAELLLSRRPTGDNARRWSSGTGGGTLRSALKLAFGTGVSFGCLYFAVRGTDWGRVGATIAAARPEWLFAVLLASVFSYYVRGQRWRVLLRPVGQVGLYQAVSATAIGFGSNMVLPLRLGEIIRPALLARNTKVSMSAALSSVLLERLFDMLLVIACFLVVSLVLPIDDKLRQTAVVLALGASAGFGVLLVMARRREAAHRLIHRVLGWLPARIGGALTPIADGLLDGLSGLGDWKTIALVLAYSAYLWFVITTTYIFSVLALHIDAPAIPAGLAAMVTVAAAAFVPQGPGFVGTWQAACVVALKFFHVPDEQAVGYALLTWAVQMAINIGIAGVFLAREDVAVGQLLRVSEAQAPATGAES